MIVEGESTFLVTDMTSTETSLRIIRESFSATCKIKRYKYEVQMITWIDSSGTDMI